MDIFENTCDHDSVENLELERFKVRLKEIWTRMLEETYAKYPDADMDMEHYKEHNALKFADEPEAESEIENLLAMLEDLANPTEELEEVKSESKAPTYGSTSLKSNNEQGSKETGIYEYKHTTTKTPTDSQAGNQGGSYEGTPSSSIRKRKNERIIRSFSPLAKNFQEELIALKDRQAIGRRRQLFRL